jgi:hypothetical protein
MMTKQSKGWTPMFGRIANGKKVHILSQYDKERKWAASL